MLSIDKPIRLTPDFHTTPLLLKETKKTTVADSSLRRPHPKEVRSNGLDMKETTSNNLTGPRMSTLMREDPHTTLLTSNSMLNQLRLRDQLEVRKNGKHGPKDSLITKTTLPTEPTKESHMLPPSNSMLRRHQRKELEERRNGRPGPKDSLITKTTLPTKPTKDSHMLPPSKLKAFTIPNSTWFTSKT